MKQRRKEVKFTASPDDAKFIDAIKQFCALPALANRPDLQAKFQAKMLTLLGKGGK